MRISQVFRLNREQPELDFVDIDTSRDLELYLDPYLLATEDGAWARRASETIRHFFTHFFRLLREGREGEARGMFAHLHEPNETCLGQSRGQPQGRGVGAGNADDLFASMRESRAVSSGMVHDLEDAEVFIRGIGPDKVSDMVTNIIRGLLIEYTQSQCATWGIPLRVSTPSGFYWVPEWECWRSIRTEMLAIDGERVLLVPKWAVSRRTRSPKDVYHRTYLLEHEKNEQLQINGLLVRERRDGSRYVTSKDLIAVGHTSRKEYLVEWTSRHIDMLEAFRERVRPRIPPMPNQHWVVGATLADICVRLQKELDAISTGPAHATRYHHCVAAILDLLLYPELANISVEEKIHAGRKRIDVLFDNLDYRGFFHRIDVRHHLPCPFVVVECKNYSRDVANPELDQLIGRFGDDRGRVGLLVCRTIDDLALFIQRCRDTFKDGHGLILPLVDEDLREMLRTLQAQPEDALGPPPYEAVLTHRLRAIVLGR